MSLLDIKALETNFLNWRNERLPHEKESFAFERYATELILKDADLDDEGISSGLTGGSGDGGVDGIYFFVNRVLITEESDTPNGASSVQLFVIQVKYENGFKEDVIVKMSQFIEDLLNFGKDVESLIYYNQRVKDTIISFREKYSRIIGNPHNFDLHFYYATKSDDPPHPNVMKRVENLKSVVHRYMSSARTEIIFQGARELTAAFRTPANRTLALDIEKSFMSNDGSVVCLARLDKFARFITDDLGQIRQYMLEPNVRDYQGERNPVNTEIRKTLSTKGVSEFWWLNNGVTILAEKCNIAAGKVEMLAPELVNGLQTSYEIYNHFSSHKAADERTVLVRVILPPNDQTRRRIVKATNNQTQVSPLSLRSTEDIHFDIEELFRLYGLYYDRRKGEHRRLKKPVSDIISIRDLAQAVLAIVLHNPVDARASPGRKLKSDEDYNKIFDVDANRELFVVCIMLERNPIGLDRIRRLRNSWRTRRV